MTQIDHESSNCGDLVYTASLNGENFAGIEGSTLTISDPSSYSPGTLPIQVHVSTTTRDWEHIYTVEVPIEIVGECTPASSFTNCPTAVSFPAFAETISWQEFSFDEGSSCSVDGYKVSVTDPNGTFCEWINGDAQTTGSPTC